MARRLLFIPLMGLVALLQACATGHQPQRLGYEMRPADSPIRGEVVEKVTGGDEMLGYIDWENRMLYAVGTGVPPADAQSTAQARELAKRAAIDEAYARLLEMSQQVRVDAQSTVRQYVATNRTVHTRVTGAVQHADIIRLRRYDDNSFQIMMNMPLDGPQGLTATLLPLQYGAVRRVGIASEVSRAETPTAPAMASRTTAYSGIIVDTQGLGFKPALFPRLLDENGVVVYDLQGANANVVLENGLCGYNKSLEAARASARVGASPLVLRAKRLEGRFGTDIILATNEVRKLAQVSNLHDLFGNARVVMVVD